MELDRVKEMIESKDGVLLYFSGEDCNVCHALRPKFKEAFDNNFPLIEQLYLDAQENPEISAYFQVFSVPTAIVFLAGREFAREGRSISIHQLVTQLERPYSIMTDQ
ncbi:thioredoxin-like [hydrothermal vent metagenome]|uniref:Thioredoxin-like n=1 Tax=hydrothermal vent metagenome TaxID=652676 RepID=A0A1W1BFC4_9ZZZZ